MDAGVAAVLGALAGSVSAAVVAFIGGRYSREVAQIGARSEHLKESWGKREERYKNFLLILGTAELQLEKIVRRLLNGQSILAELEVFIDAVKPIENARTEVALAGPLNTHESARLATVVVLFVCEKLEDHKLAHSYLAQGPFPMGTWEMRMFGEGLARKLEELEGAKKSFEARAVQDLQDFGFRR